MRTARAIAAAAAVVIASVSTAHAFPQPHIERKTAAQRCGVSWPWKPFYYTALVALDNARLTPGEFRAVLIMNGMAPERVECVTEHLAPRV